MSKDETAKRMAADLRNLQIDLGDERDVIRALTTLRYSQGDILVSMDDAIEIARAAPKNLSSIIGDGAAAVFAGAVWLAWYVVLCPPVAS